jgi:hypothetical protein
VILILHPEELKSFEPESVKLMSLSTLKKRRKLEKKQAFSK